MTRRHAHCGIRISCGITLIWHRTWRGIETVTFQVDGNDYWSVECEQPTGHF
jgi:hypothetical protein